ncbi:MAG: peptidoglycan DD-metalloendopeptidase family protein [Bacteroidia bacterium]|nr:peptidoglycan DD-metalloendopeptidase family protein [Bacteroidia bacterium]
MNADKRILFGFIFLFILVSFGSSAQRNKNQLQKEKQKNIEKIKQTEKILTETAKQKKNSVGELTALNQRISDQENLIASIKSEISLLEEDINENNDIISALEQDLAKLKEEYAAMLFSAQKASGKVTKLTFLFSAESFEQMLMRLKYMEQYGAVRQEQAEVIGRVQKLLSSQVRQTEIIKTEKNTLLRDEVTENDNLSDLKGKQKAVLQSLVKEEKRLKKDLEVTKKSVAQLDKLINDIIKEELERAAREAREAKEKKTANASKATEAAVALSSSFEENKAKFLWPAPGFVSQRFGRQNHPVLKGIQLQNDGINIQTKQDEKVKSIFQGEVRRVAFIPSIGSSVIISHGEYFTVYSGLKEVFVKQGQRVSTNQEIGKISVNGDGISELRFQIRKSTLALDPQAWLKE